MKTNQERDTLDQRIDALLESRPLQASDDFAARVLAASEAAQTSGATEPATRRPIGKIVAFALPLAAAIAVAVSLLQVGPPASSTGDSVALTVSEAEEIFLLEESLNSLATLSTGDFASGDLLSTLDALALEI